MDDLEIMRRVVALSKKAVVERQGGPFGAVVLKDGAIIAEAHNEVLSSKDPTAHAELLAVRRACAVLGSFDLSSCVLYTNASPCCMCSGCMLWAKLGHVYYILPMEDSAAIGLGDGDFYEDLSRSEERREIVPFTRLPALAEEARAVLHFWRDDPGRVTF